MARCVEVVYHLMQQTPLQLQALLLLSLIILLLRLATTGGGGSSKQAKAKRLPPSPPALPIIGHLHLVGDLPHVSLRSLSRTHAADGLMLLHLGSVPNLVVSSPRAAQAVMRTNDHLFASRPPSRIADALLYGWSSDIAFSPYGEHWRQARRLVTTHLFTVKKVQLFRIARQQEVKVVISRIREAAAASVAVDLGEVVNTYANDVVCRAVSGKFFRAEGRNKMFRELIEENSALVGGFHMEDYFPRLAKVRLLHRFVRNNVETTHKRWDELLEAIIRDHEKNPMHHGRENGVDEQGESDFIDVLLSVQQEFHGITRDHIKAILMDLFGAGTDTSSLVLEFAMAELMRKPDQLMVKLQAEVRRGTPAGQEFVEEHNLAGMTYLKAVVKETLRLHPPAPLLLPHLAMADCDLDGYSIPSETRVIVNAWAIGRDPGSWEKPDDFVPERFLEGGTAAAVDLTGKDFQFVPFGAGRRICPGLNFGLATVEIMLANLAYCFDWELPVGMERDEIDMTEVFGLTVRRKEKLMLVPNTHVVA
ncbi:indole-2-monooxygenase-like [Triticum dicoccoides]|uniref:indole-2-monooxygenase-like n=1 Tax=Triticum dicoccoides TaxID=85692 RepID=UPI00189033C5|nr:indole-2-monooxygenase-like [Triticum dicoccoides]